MKYFFLFVILLNCKACFSQKRDKELITLATIFHKYHSSEHVERSAWDELNDIQSDDLQKTQAYISEIIKTNGSILNDKFLTKPDIATLQSVYIILNLNYNMFKDKPESDEVVLKRLQKSKVSEEILLTNYYLTIFTNLVNKNSDIDLSERDFNFTKLNLTTKTEKGIFFLTAMEGLGIYNWGKVEMTDSLNYLNVLDLIKRYPKFGGNPFYLYNDFDFADFKLKIDIRRPTESFKEYYIGKYIRVLQFYFSQFIEAKRN
ncbi:MAG: hypothetical protein QM737_18700 [Ferruginibacter sp.]